MTRKDTALAHLGIGILLGILAHFLLGAGHCVWAGIFILATIERCSDAFIIHRGIKHPACGQCFE